MLLHYASIAMLWLAEACKLFFFFTIGTADEEAVSLNPSSRSSGPSRRAEDSDGMAILAAEVAVIFLFKVFSHLRSAHNCNVNISAADVMMPYGRRAALLIVLDFSHDVHQVLASSIAWLSAWLWRK